jgi:hypothetical protein
MVCVCVCVCVCALKVYISCRQADKVHQCTRVKEGKGSIKGEQGQGNPCGAAGESGLGIYIDVVFWMQTDQPQPHSCSRVPRSLGCFHRD